MTSSQEVFRKEVEYEVLLRGRYIWMGSKEGIWISLARDISRIKEHRIKQKYSLGHMGSGDKESCLA